MELSRRKLLSSAVPAAALIAAGGLAGCATTTNPTTGVVTYGLDPSVVSTIQAVVAAVANYTPAVESIAETAAGLFGPTYAAIVSAGSAALNTLEGTLESVVSSLPVGGRKLGRKLGATPTGTLVGYAKTPQGYVAVFAQ
jgi:hypothetical protein